MPNGAITIARDEMGIPHVSGDTIDECRMGLGFAMATDRLWQLDYLSRRAAGRLSEVLGSEAIGLDAEARIIGFVRIAEGILRRATPQTKASLAYFAAGINCAIEQGRGSRREFEVLGYSPRRWTPVDALAVHRMFAWQLSGRLRWLTGPELVQRHLPPDLAEAFLEGIRPQVSVVGNRRQVALTNAGFEQSGTTGSNAWAIGARRSTTGFPMVASDPHLPLTVPSIWYESHLIARQGYEVAGISHVGVPTFVAGRNEHVAWGITNNLCSIRDLYREATEPTAAPDSGRNATFERIQVRSAPDVEVEVRRTSIGPVVNELLDVPFRDEGPISLRWTGFAPSDEVGVMIAYESAASVADFRDALATWGCPTWNFTMADSSGLVGYQCVGAIPARGRRHLGIRTAEDPRDEWTGLIETPELPGELDPDRGWVATANNLVSFDDWPTLQAGFWPGSDRADRIAEMLEGSLQHHPADLCRQQLDTLSSRAVTLLPPLLRHLSSATLTGRERDAATSLRRWDMRFDRESIGASIFESFFQRWLELVVAERVPAPVQTVVAPRGEDLAGRLLDTDDLGWFSDRDIESRVIQVFRAAIADLANRIGSKMSEWQWGKLHAVLLRHPLASELGPRATIGPVAVHGGWNTVNNAPYDLGRPFDVTTGVSHRLVASLGPSGGLLSASSSGSSGDPTSPHYRDGLAELAEGVYHELWTQPKDGQEENLQPARVTVIGIPG